MTHADFASSITSDDEEKAGLPWRDIGNSATSDTQIMGTICRADYRAGSPTTATESRDMPIIKSAHDPIKP
jgi:hypothetical protein